MKIEVGKGTPVSAPITPGMDDMNPWATHVNEFGRGGIKLTGSKKGLSLIPLERRKGSIVLVKSGDEGQLESYMWTGIRDDGTDGKWEPFNFPGLIIVADTEGAIPTGRHTLVFGPDFSIEEAGDQGAGVLVQLSDAAKQSGDGALISVGTYGEAATFGKGNSLEFEWPLKAWADADKAKAFRVSMEHGVFQRAAAPNYLAYLGADEEVLGKVHQDAGHHKGAIWCDDVVVGAGTYIEVDKVGKALGLQEADDKDPNVSGGMNYIVAIVSGMHGIAPEEGTVRQYLWDTTAGSYAEDLNGHPIATEIHYKDGESLRNNGNPLLTVGILNEKGLHKLGFHVEDSFVNDNVILGTRTSGPTGIVVQALTPDSKTGDAWQQFELDTGIKIPFRVEWMGQDRASLGWVLGHNEPVTWGAAGAGQKMNDGWVFHNLTPAKMGIVDGELVVEDTTAKEADANIPGKATEICDFYFGKIFDGEETGAMRGHESEVDAALIPQKGGWRFAMVVWEGEEGKYTPVFDDRDNGEPLLNKGWRIVDSGFVSEDASGESVALAKVVTVPVGANNFGWIVYPEAAESPMQLRLSKMDVNTKDAFTAAVVKRPIMPNEKGLEFATDKQKFVQDNQGNASLRYTINKADTPMPVGISESGLAGFTVDKSVNVIVGSGARGGEGAYVFPEDGRAVFKIGRYAYPGEKLGAGIKANVRFWAGTYDKGTGKFVKIPESETVRPVTGEGLPVYMAMNPFAVEGKQGDMVALFASTDADDDAYIKCSNPAKPLSETDIVFTRMANVNYEG